MKKVLLLLAAAMLAAAPAKAVTLGGQNWTATGTILTLTPAVPTGNQPLNVQCVICGDNQPQQQANFGYTNFKNNGSDSDLLFFSTNVAGGGNPGPDTVGIGYDGTFLRDYIAAHGAVNLTFAVGIDVNDAGKTPQVLESFYLLNLTQKTVLAAFLGPADIGSKNNGTGFPDYTLEGFNIALGSDISIGDQLIFFARISNASDGPDSFFLIPNVEIVTPLPATVWLFGSAIGGAAVLLRRRRRKEANV